MLPLNQVTIEHAERAGDMKAADRDRDVSLTQCLGEVESAHLVGTRD
jgi:hypothetical protein